MFAVFFGVCFVFACEVFLVFFRCLLCGDLFKFIGCLIDELLRFVGLILLFDIIADVGLNSVVIWVWWLGGIAVWYLHL